MSNDHDNDHDGVVATSGALTSLKALETLLANVDTASVAGRSGLPMLQFKSRENGTWSYGQKRTIVEDDSRWAINPLTFKWGYICFSSDKKVLAEHLVSVSHPKPNIADLPDKGFDWSEQWVVNLKCLDGADAGVEVTFKPTTDGGVKAIAGLIEAVRDRLGSGAHGGDVVPIVKLGRDHYQHPQHGKICTPLPTIVGWMPLDGPAPAAAAPTPAAPTSTEEQPRRRRVVA